MAPSVSVAHALAVYAESLVARRRVLVVGDASLALDDVLVEMGARLVHVLDPDAGRARARAREASRGVVVRELPDGEIDVREGAFDLVLVPDLAAIEDRAGLLARLRRLVGNDGAALIAAKSAARADGEERPAGPTPGALDYYEMYDLVALQFASVRMIAEVPFAGVALAELGERDEAPAVSVDTQLVTEAEAPESFIALASQREVTLEPYAIVQLPRVAATPSAPVSESRAIGEAELAAAVLRGELLSSQLEEQRALVTQLRADQGAAERASELDAQLRDRIAKLKEAETRAGDHYVRAERLAHDVARLEDELARARDRAARLSKELEEEKHHRARAESDLGLARKGGVESAMARERIALLEDGLRAAEEATSVLQARAIEAEQTIHQREAQLEMLARELTPAREALARAEQAEARFAIAGAQLAELTEAHESELATFEGILRKSGATVSALERELVRREGIVRELVARLEEIESVESAESTSRSPASHVASEAMNELGAHLRRALAENAEMRSKLDALALDVARREGELHARAWRIAELEQRVASFEARPPVSPEPAAPAAAPGAPGPLHAELAALRQALTQEHEARVRSESGEELARARADLARQAALLEQLSRELEARGGQIAEGSPEPG